MSHENNILLLFVDGSTDGIEGERAKEITEHQIQAREKSCKSRLKNQNHH